MRSFLAVASTCVAASFVTSCSSNISPPISVVSPALSKKPYVILTADRSVVKEGETVHLFVTIVNPTKRRLMSPTESAFETNDAPIAHNLVVDWNGESGGSATAMSYHGIHTNPPFLSYLEPGEKKSYRLSWTNSFDGKGSAELELKLGTILSEFPVSKMTLATE